MKARCKITESLYPSGGASVEGSEVCVTGRSQGFCALTASSLSPVSLAQGRRARSRSLSHACVPAGLYFCTGTSNAPFVSGSI